MGMNSWILEVGNTRAKWARFRTDQPLSSSISSVQSTNSDDLKVANSWRAQMEAGDQLLISGSGPVETWASAFPDAFVLLHGDATLIATKVEHPESLGIDRIANVCAVISGACPDVDPMGSWLIVDAGTCITMDLVVRGIHEGGTIAPGIGMRLRAMNHGTRHLPFLNWPVEDPTRISSGHAIGLNTRDALYAGCASGVALEIRGKWHALSEKHPGIGIILTGGDYSYLELRSILPKFADSSLTLKGYHALFQNILQHP